uniref:Putative plant transposon protein domain-containing protein n=1 Tax=Solanum tuberosum TaxID=4113 RepID=M1DHG8_SOLTU
MPEGNGSKLAETNQEVEKDFKLTALVTQLNDLATKISEVEDQCKSQGRNNGVLAVTVKCGECVEIAFGELKVHSASRRIGVAGSNSRRWIENRHVGPFGELGRARRTTRRFAKSPCIAFNFKPHVLLVSATFGETLEFAKSIRRLAKSLLVRPLSLPRILCCTEPPPGDKGKGKRLLSDRAAASPRTNEPDDEQLLRSQPQRFEFRTKSHHTPTITHPATTPAESAPTPAPNVAPVLRVILLPRLINRLKGDVLPTILEEKLLFIKRLEDRYPNVAELLQWHQFQIFTRPRSPYIPSWVHEFYAAYGELVPNSKKKACEFRPVNSVTVRGVEVSCNEEHINVVLDMPPRNALA